MKHWKKIVVALVVGAVAYMGFAWHTVSHLDD